VNRRRWTILIIVCGLIAVLFAAGFGQHLRLKRAVQRYERQLARDGVKLSIQELAPRTTRQGTETAAQLWAAMTQMSGLPANAQLSCMRGVAPGRAIVSWQQDPLIDDNATNMWPALESCVADHSNALAMACAALESDVLEFDLNYARGFNLLLTHLGHLKKLTRLLSAAVIVELRAGRTQQAWPYLRAMARLHNIYNPEPTMISHLVHIATGALAWSATWEALQHPGWTEAQLAELQELWAGADFLDGIDVSFGMERAFTRLAIEQLRVSQKEWQQYQSGVVTGGSGGRASTLGDLIDEPSETVKEWTREHFGYWPWRWWDSYEEELFGARACQVGMEAAKTLRAERSYRSLHLAKKMADLERAHPHAKNRFVLVAWHNGMPERFLTRAATGQTQREMMVAGIALHRYRLSRGAWPTNLSQLTPGFVKAPPIDFMDGQPLRYRTNNNGSFVLYSVGKGMVDNGGDATPTQQNPQVWVGKDWVWPTPASADEIAAFWKKRKQ
jgi:hypothetical protein